jgi:hypothetical protein
MEYTSIRDHLKYINANGLTLSIDERLNLDLALQKLQLDFGFEELLLWGKITGKQGSLDFECRRCKRLLCRRRFEIHRSH